MGYWIFEFVKVLAVYVFIMFIWPAVVFRSYLRGKSLTFRFSFLSLVAVVVYNMMVLIPGLLHMLKTWLVFMAFWSVFIISLRPWNWFTYNVRNNSMKLLLRLYTSKQLGYFVVGNLNRIINEKCGVAIREFRKRWLEYSLLLIICVYGILYFSIGAFETNSYGFGDTYVHHAWIYGLIQGDIFSSGIYPEGMHTFVYIFHACFGLEVYNVLLFLPCIHNLTLFLSMYCLLKECFQWRWSAILAMALFLIFGMKCIDGVFGLSRLQWAVPQDFGLYSVYLCALYLIRYLNTEGDYWKKTFLLNGELLVFVLAVCVSFMIHFYVTIIAVFVCLSILVFRITKLFVRRHFISLLAGAIAGIALATIPMAGAFVEGKEFQGSIGWALGVFEESIKVSDENAAVGPISTPEIFDEFDLANFAIGDQIVFNEEGEIIQVIKKDGTIIERDDVTGESAVITPEEKEGLFQRVVSKCHSIYKNSYETLYLKTLGHILCVLTGIALGLSIVSRLYIIILNIVKKQGCEHFTGDLGVIMIGLILMLMYAAPFVGMPELVHHARLTSTIHVFMASTVLVIVDVIIFVVFKTPIRKTEPYVAVLLLVAEILCVVYTGNYHSYLYYEFTRYNEAVYITRKIANECKHKGYTIVSMTDELYQVIQDGWHEEWYTFLRSQGDESYTIPTSDIFFYIEKKPLQYGQSHFSVGPSWLADTKYPSYYNNFVSQEPEITASSIYSLGDEESKEIPESNSPSKLYSNLESRTLIYSCAMDWVYRFSKMYPNEMQVFYEDERFICYHVKQNPNVLYNLALGNQ